MAILQAVRKKEDNENNLCGPIIPTIKTGRRILRQMFIRAIIAYRIPKGQVSCVVYKLGNQAVL